MAKNRTELEQEALELGLNPDNFGTNNELKEAIAGAKANTEGDGEDTGGVNTDEDTQNPQDNQENIEAPMSPEDEPKKKGKKAEKEAASFETTKEVSFIINGKEHKGSTFTFDSAVEAENHKKMLIARHGAGVIKE